MTTNRRHQITHLLLSLYTILFLVILGYADSESLQDGEKALLMRIKQHFDNPPTLSHWTPNSSPCSWPQINCTGDSVTGLSLAHLNVTGAVPPFICDLKNLTVIDLQDNSIYDQLPKALYNCLKLEYLDLANNYFVGVIPNDIDRLVKVTYLNLGNNNFSGDIPASIGLLQELRTLRLGGCLFNNTLPPEIGNLANLEMLQIGYNFQLKPSRLPSTYTQLKKLKKLWIPKANLNGEIPEAIGDMASLEELDLSDNGLSGKIPSGVFMLKNLRILYLYKNRLSGEIAQVVEATNMEVLDLSQNNLTGPIPEDFGNLTYFSLAACNISEFPEFLKSQHELEVLDLSNNRLEGPIPSWFLDVATESLTRLNLSYNFISSWEQAPLILPWKKLIYLGLHSNKLQGSLVVPSLSTAYYIISKNNLSGSIHPLFCELSHLLVLDVSNNNLTGIIPTCLGKHGTSLWKLRTMDLSNNQLQGKVPLSLIRCTKLEILNLGHNQIRGTFPFWLSKLPELQVLVLRSNQFYGHVRRSTTEPLDFKKLRIIDLSFNKFSGNLQSEYFTSWSAMIEASNRKNLGQLRYMEYGCYYYDSVTVMNKGLPMELVKITTIFTSIDLSNNRFDGEIPRSMKNLLSLHVLNLSNNSFRGPIPSAFGNLKELESLDLSKNNLTGRIPLDFVKLTFLAYLNLSDNLLTGHIPEGGQIGTFPSSAFEGNPGLCGSPLARKCDDEHAEPPASLNNNQESDDFDFGWRVVVMGYGCGLVVGLVAGHVIVSKWPNWFSKTFRVNLLQRRRI